MQLKTGWIVKLFLTNSQVKSYTFSGWQMDVMLWTTTNAVSTKHVLVENTFQFAKPGYMTSKHCIDCIQAVYFAPLKYRDNVCRSNYKRHKTQPWKMRSWVHFVDSNADLIRALLATVLHFDGLVKERRNSSASFSHIVLCSTQSCPLLLTQLWYAINTFRIFELFHITLTAHRHEIVHSAPMEVSW